MAWSSQYVCRVMVPDANSPGDKFYFDGMNAGNDPINQPLDVQQACNAILAVVGKACTQTGMERTIKQEAS